MFDTSFVYIIQNDKFFEYTHTYHDEEYLLENFNCDIMFDTRNILFKTRMWRCCDEIINKQRYKFISTKKLNQDFINQLRIK